MELIFLLAILYSFTFLVGSLFERMRIPWVFSALLLGLGIAVYDPFPEATGSETFEFLAQLGMYSLLFLVGFELDFERIGKMKTFVVKATIFIISLEAIVGSLFVHFVFGTPWLIAILVGTAWATVGEAMLIPILDEFNLIKTDLGQAAIGIGTLDDIIEIVLIILAVALISGGSIGVTVITLITLFGLTYVFSKLGYLAPRIKFMGVSGVFLLMTSILFIFLSIGSFLETAAIGALLAGIASRNIVPEELFESEEQEIKSTAYAMLAPIFFVWVGKDVGLGEIPYFPLTVPILAALVLAKVVLSKGTKIIGSYIIGRDVLGGKESIILGICLSVKFSTSIIIFKLLFEHGLISVALYSVLIISKVVFKFIIPFLLPYLISKWEIGPTVDGRKIA